MFNATRTAADNRRAIVELSIVAGAVIPASSARL